MSREQITMATASPPLGELSFAEEKKAGEILQSETEGKNGSDLILARRGLTPEQKRFIVESYACFQPLTEIEAALLKRWQIRLDRRHLASFDAGRPDCRIGQRLKRYYAECRKAYIEGVRDVAISHQAHRLRLVGRIVEKATTSKDYAAALKGLELAAKEMGGALASVHTVRHEGQIAHVHATVEEARREVAARLAQVIEGGTLLPMPMATPPATEGEGGA